MSKCLLVNRVPKDAIYWGISYWGDKVWYKGQYVYTVNAESGNVYRAVNRSFSINNK